MINGEGRPGLERPQPHLPERLPRTFHPETVADHLEVSRQVLREWSVGECSVGVRENSEVMAGLLSVVGSSWEA